jgi:hypothetical protein
MFGFRGRRSLTSWSKQRVLINRMVRTFKDVKAKGNVLEASVAMRSKISLTKLLRIAIALFEIPVSGWTCLRTEIA